MPWQDKPPANRSGIADGKHGVLGAPMQMQCKETHKCSQKQISWVRVKFSKSPAESPETVDVPERPGRDELPFRSFWGHYSSGLSNCHGSKSEPKSPNPANRFEKTDFWKKCQIWTALPDTESPPKYFILEEFKKPWLVCLRPRVRHHQSCLGSGTWVRLGKVTSWAPPLARS